MATTNKGFKIIATDNKIAITKEFEKKASKLDSPEYNTLIKLRTDNPGYTFIRLEQEKKKVKRTYKELTFENMEKFLATRDNAADVLEAFENAKKYYKSYAAYYARVKSWFLEYYKEDYKKYVPAASVPVPAESEDDTPLDNSTAPAAPAPARHINNAPQTKAAA